MRMVGLFFAGAVGLLRFVNGLFMFISPRKWFEMPSFFPVRGSLTKKTYSSGLGAVEVRIVGLVSMGLVLWVLYDGFLSSH
jgi:uncharacterized protein YjeT (DUF2065 family)